jgi:hypothetical protein
MLTSIFQTRGLTSGAAVPGDGRDDLADGTTGKPAARGPRALPHDERDHVVDAEIPRLLDQVFRPDAAPVEGQDLGEYWLPSARS